MDLTALKFNNCIYYKFSRKTGPSGLQHAADWNKALCLQIYLISVLICLFKQLTLDPLFTTR